MEGRIPATAACAAASSSLLLYAAKRLALLPVTLLLAGLVVFVVLNLAPGEPGALPGGLLSDGAAALAPTEAASRRAFRRQFHLDKPVLLNTRFLLSRQETRRLLVTAHGLGEDPGDGTADQTARRAERARAAARLDDLGPDLVRHLVPLLQEDPQAEVQRLAAAYLSHIVGTGASRTAAAAGDGASLAGARWDPGAPAEAISSVKAAWRTWWARSRAEHTYTVGRALSTLLLDTRFAHYLASLLRLDFGCSLLDQQPVFPVVLARLHYSIAVISAAVLLALVLALPLGLFTAVRAGSLQERLLTAGLFGLYSLPTFFTGTLLLRLLAEGDPLTWFPTGGFASETAASSTLAAAADVAWHLVLPVVTYAAAALAVLTRHAHAGLIEVLRAPHVTTARAKGLDELSVLLKHVLRNGLTPLVTLLGGVLPLLVSGSLVIEVVFGIPGMGLYLYDAINLRDYNAVMAVLAVASTVTILGVLIADLCSALLDPRVRFDAL